MPASVDLPMYGYETYDCVPAGEGPAPTPGDLLIASGLNGRLDVDAVCALQWALPQAFTLLSRVEQEVTFWKLSRTNLNNPLPSTPEWHVYEAWRVMMSAPDVDVAITHKTLHHKRPALFPLLDNVTVKELNAVSNGDAWVQLHQELSAHDSEFGQLEEDFAAVVQKVGQGVALTRLRIHDILLWCRLKGKDSHAYREGKAILAGVDG